MHLNCQNIWAVGRNYAEHIRELGNDANSQAKPSNHSSTKNPMIFLKSGSSIVANSKSFSLPKFSNDVHHEVEVALRFGPELDVDAFTIALDLTARDTQNLLKAAAHPWTLAKSFKHSCPLGEWSLLSADNESKAFEKLSDLKFSLRVNGELRQQGNTKDMIFSMQTICDYVREHFAVLPGDVVLTGTPAGVAAIKPNDFLEAEISNFTKANWRVESSYA